MSAPWEKYQQQPAAPATSAPMPQRSFPGVIQGAPDPAKQAAEARAAAGDARDERRLNITEQNAATANQLAQIKIAEANDKALERQKLQRAQETGIQDSLAQMRRVVEAAEQAKELSDSFFATGFGSSVAQSVGGTKATDVAALLNTIGSNTAFDRLQRMREESKTGGALGAVSEIELRLLRDSIASLDQSQSDEQFRANMDKVIEAYSTVISRLEGSDNAQQEEARPSPPSAVTPNEPDEPEGLSFGLGEGRSYGNDGSGNPLVIDTPDGLQVLLQGDGPLQYGLASDPEFIERNANPEALRLLNEVSRMDKVYGESGAMDLAKSGMTLGLLDESTGVGTAIGRALTGDFNITDNYALGRDAERLRLDRAREKTGGVGVAAEVAGGLGLGRMKALAGGAGGLVAPTTVRQAGREGALAGAVGGFGYGEGAQGSAVNALAGGALGGALGAGGQKIGNALAQRAANRANNGAQVQAAADDLGIETIPAMTGGTGSRRLTGAARQGFISDRPIAAQIGKIEGQATQARDDIARGVGQAVDAEDAGEIVRNAAKVYSKRTSQIGGKLYDRADKFAGDAKFPLPSAIKAVDEELAQLAQAPGGTEGSLYKSLTALRQQMDGGEFPVQGIRAFRTTLRNEITAGGLRGSPQDVAFNRVLRAAEDDMINGLRAAGNEKAIGAMKTATDFWRKRVETIDEVLEPVLGKNSPRSGEQILAAVERMAKPDSGNANRLRQLFKSMPQDEADAVRATVINRLGRPTRGAAEMAEDGGFSFNTFLTNWNNMTPRAKATMFPGESIQALNKLAQVSKGFKEAGGAMNSSNTAGAVINQGAVSGGLFIIEPFAAAAGALGQHVTGKLLASPRVARWLAGAPKTAKPAARRRYISQLGQIAKAQPALAGDLQLLERAMLKAANDNSGRTSLVAEDSQQQVPQE